MSPLAVLLRPILRIQFPVNGVLSSLSTTVIRSFCSPPSDPQGPSRSESKRQRQPWRYAKSTRSRLPRGRCSSSITNPRLSEVITIYEKLTKEDRDYSFTTGDFSIYRNSPLGPYAAAFFTGGQTQLLQSSVSLEDLLNQSQADPSLLSLAQPPAFLILQNPTKEDLRFLTSTNPVLQTPPINPLTLRDVREPNTEEKVEFFRDYIFLSLKLYENSRDLNLLLYPSTAVLIHFGEDHWIGTRDVLGFLNLLAAALSNGNGGLAMKDQPLFSIFIELSQDAKFALAKLEPKIMSLNDTTQPLDNPVDLAAFLRANYSSQVELYKLDRFIQPKIKVLKRLMGHECGRIEPQVVGLLQGVKRDLEEVEGVLSQLSHVLERAQDTCLTLASIRQTQEANGMANAMKRVSEVALLFLPLQAIAGFLGMNVKVPLQDLDHTGPFWGIVAGAACGVAGMWFMWWRK